MKRKESAERGGLWEYASEVGPRLLKATSGESRSAFCSAERPDLRVGRVRVLRKMLCVQQKLRLLLDACGGLLIERAISRKMISQESDATNAGRFEDHRHGGRYWEY